MHVATVPSAVVREPPYDDSLWPALALLFITVLFTACLLGFMWLAKDYADFNGPTPSTLPPLGL